MIRPTLAKSCCTTPSAALFWGAMFVLFYGVGLTLRAVWPALQPFGDTLILGALAAACFLNFARNRTLHCGLTGPLFLLGAFVALLMEAGMWNLDHSVFWSVVLIGVALAFFAEWRWAPR